MVPAVIVAVEFTLMVAFAVCTVVAAAPPVPPPATATPALAATVVVRLVVNCVVARPLASVVTTLAVNEPAPEDVVALVSIEKLTGTPGSGLPLVSLTVAVRSVVPPAEGRVVGFAPSETDPTAAAPI